MNINLNTFSTGPLSAQIFAVTEEIGTAEG